MRKACLILLIFAFAAEVRGQAADTEMATRVRDEFIHAWKAYKKYAWPHDELMPLSRKGRDWHSASLLMTPVDALDTMYIMGLNHEADKTREYIAKHLSFDHDIYVKNFEVTIRILGGLLSSYQITQDKRLLDLADELGKRLLPAFESRTGMPFMYVNLKTGAVRGEESNPAEIGTLILEFGVLSKLTQKPVYYEKAKRALSELFERRSPIGLVGSVINVNTGKWMNPSSHISGGIDSYYEYLLKCARLFEDRECETMMKTSLDAVNQYLADDTQQGLWYSYVDMNNGKRKLTHYGSLDAFFPAVLLLSGDKLKAERLQDSGYRMWTAFGIEPEEIDYSNMSVAYDGYALRPEIIESAYYLYSATKDPKYLMMGRTFFESLRRYCRTRSGYAALESVQTKKKKDIMHSFFLAETLKYLYLLFSSPNSFDPQKVTFNTEAHPLRKTW